MPDKTLCHGCIGDEVLAHEVRKTGAVSTCYACKRRRKGWPLDQVASRIHDVLKANYHTVHAGPYDYYGFRSGNDPADTITELAGLDDTTIGKDIQDILSARCGYSAIYDGEMDPYGDDVVFVFNHADTSVLHHGWKGFCDLLRTRSRFFNSTARGMLNGIFGDLPSLNAGRAQPVVRTFPATGPTRFYRGRVATEEATLERILADPVREMGAPPHVHARVGRMNAPGISLFYGALDVETCLAELRPPVGSNVAIASFENVRPLRLLDLGRLRSISVGGSLFSPDFRERFEQAAFLGRLVAELSRPIMPGSEEMDYLSTQAVAEYLADREDLELDGILFPSSQRIDGELNVVLFHQASRVDGKLLPAGSQTALLGPQYDEDGEPDGVTVWVRAPRLKRKAKARRSPGAPFDMLFDPDEPTAVRDEIADSRQATLKWVPNSLEVHAIKQVTYTKDLHSVKRHVERRKGRPKRKVQQFDIR